MCEGHGVLRHRGGCRPPSPARTRAKEAEAGGAEFAPRVVVSCKATGEEGETAVRCTRTPVFHQDLLFVVPYPLTRRVVALPESDTPKLSKARLAETTGDTSLSLAGGAGAASSETAELAWWAEAAITHRLSPMQAFVWSQYVMERNLSFARRMQLNAEAACMRSMVALKARREGPSSFRLVLKLELFNGDQFVGA